MAHIIFILNSDDFDVYTLLSYVQLGGRQKMANLILNWAWELLKHSG